MRLGRAHVSLNKIPAIAVSAVGIVALVPPVAEAARFEGTVVAKKKSARTFTLKQDQGGGTETNRLRLHDGSCS